MGRLPPIAALALAAAAARASEWPGFRGPTGLGLTEDRDLPVEWGGKDGKNVLWAVDLPRGDNPYSSPVTAGGQVVVTSAVNSTREHRVTAFAKADGKVLWETKVEPGPWKLTDLRGGYAAPTPAADGERILAVFGSAVIAALDLRGNLLWRRELPRYAFDVAIGSSPVLFEDTAIYLADQYERKSSLIAFSKATGEVKWEAMRPDATFAHSTPVLASVKGAPQLLVSASNGLQGLDPRSGATIWRCAAEGESASPAFDGSLVYCDSGRGGQGACVDPTGTGDVTKTHLRWKISQVPEGLSSPAIVDGKVFRLHGPDILKAIDLATGAVLSATRLEGVSTWSSPIIAPGGILYLSSAGKSYVVRAGAKPEVIAANDLGDPGRATPAVSDGRLYLKGERKLFCVGKR